MKKVLLFLIILLISIHAIAQIKECYPNGFRRAEIPASLKNHAVKVSYSSNPEINSSSSRIQPNASNIVLNDSEQLVGCTFFELETYNSISNRIVVNYDGTISLTYNFSPDAIQTTNPPFPHRSSGYNYYNGSTWYVPNGCPGISTTPYKVDFPNIVVTPSGKEMIVARRIYDTATTGIDSIKIIVLWSATKGTGVWDTIMYPWHSLTYYSLPKACGGITNENVYVIFQGDNGQTSPYYPYPVLDGQYGPIYFSKSTDGGLTWSPNIIIPDIDSTHYYGFSGDSYSIDAIGDTVAITFGNEFTDVGLLKSTDAGQTWTKYIIQQHPQPMYNPLTDSLTDINHNGVIDTILSNGGDSKVLIDNNGMCHVWFSSFRYYNDSAGDGTFYAFYNSDNLYYWNETMPQNNGYVAIASAQDFNGNGIIDIPLDTSTTCSNTYPWSFYGNGMTQMPSAGIDSTGKIFLSYQTIREPDNTISNEAHKHIFLMTLAPPYNPLNWTYPYDIIPSTANGGDGEHQDGIFACTARKVENNNACVLYSRSNPGIGEVLSVNGSCHRVINPFNNSYDFVLNKVDALQNALGIDNPVSNELFVSQNYPNPSSGLTSIDVGTRKSSEIKIEVNDFTGRIVYKVTQGVLPAGTYTIHLNTGELSQGIYTYTILSDGIKTTRRMIVN